MCRHGPSSDRQAAVLSEMQAWKNPFACAYDWPRDELNDLCTHESPSHTAIAIRPANESDIRYAVMLVSFEHEARHCRARPGNPSFAEELFLWMDARIKSGPDEKLM
jgi:hypothetical protein